MSFPNVWLVFPWKTKGGFLTMMVLVRFGIDDTRMTSGKAKLPVNIDD